MNRYSEEHVKWLRTWYPHWKIPKLTRKFNFRFKTKKTETAIKAACNNHKIHCGRPVGNPRGSFILLTKRQAGYLRRIIKKHTHAEAAQMMNRVYGTHFTEGQMHSFTANHDINSGRTGCFPVGHKPWNTGTKGMGICKRNRGTFKKGHIPGNTRKIGSERIDTKDGYVLIKIRERNPYTGASTRFNLKHVFLWEKKNGPVPENHVIMFKDGNKRNFSRDNLVCVSKAMNARLNQLHYAESHPNLKESIFALAKFKTVLGEKRRALKNIDPD